MNITIVGGGNIGTQFTVHFAAKKHNVILYTSQPHRFQKSLSIIDSEDQTILTVSNFIVTDSAEKAFAKADIIFITVPAFAMKKMADLIMPYIHNNLKIVFVPGTGGPEWAFNNSLYHNIELFGLQRVPSVARLVNYGSIVRCIGYRNDLYLGSISSKNSLYCIRDLLTESFGIPCHDLPNYLSVSLTPSNPILHTSRLYNLFSDYSSGKVYPNNSLFYEDWNDETSEILFSMDSELQMICKNLKEFDLSSVFSLRKHYESETTQQLTQKIRSIKSFKGLKTPMIKVDTGFIPDFNSRYFTADFPYGLAILLQIGKLLDIECHNMEKVMTWYNSLQPQVKKFDFTDYGIKNKKGFIDYYNRIIV